MTSMAPLCLDHQRGPGAPSWRGTALLVLAVVAGMLTAIHYAALSRKADQWEARTEQMKLALSRQSPPGSGGGPAAADFALEVSQAKSIVQELTLPWGRLFQAIESSGSKDVTLLALEPAPERAVVKIGGEAKNMPALLDYMRRLQDCDAFSAVYLQSHQVQLQDAQKPVRFVLLAKWRDRS